MPRHFLTIMDLAKNELTGVLDLAVRCKRNRRLGRDTLKGKTIALIFQKPSMRTRVAFEVAVLQLGGSVTYLGQEDIQLGRREPIKDVARVLSRYVDGIVVRTFAHADVQAFAGHASVPVINGLSDLVHPCQALADLFTLEEHFGRLKGLHLAYVGDGNNVLHSLLQGGMMLGLTMTVSTPPRYRPNTAIWKEAARWAGVSGGALRWEPDPGRALRAADVVYTDVWVSMGQERERARRLKVFRRYQLNAALLGRAKADCWIMHCLPAHRGEEITEESIESSHSLILPQAENRLHVQKALLSFLLGKGLKWRPL